MTMSPNKLKAQITTQAVIMDQKGRVLLLKRNKLGGLFTLPGGTIHQGEEIKVGLKRELKEEVGLDISVGDPVWVWQSDHIGQDLVGIVFSTIKIMPDDNIIILSEEHSQWAWFSRDELFSGQDVDPYIKTAELDKHITTSTL